LLKSQNLLKTRFSTGFPTRFGQVADMSQTSQRPNKSLRHVADLTDLSQHIEIDLAGLRHVGDFFAESRFWARSSGL